MNIKHTHPAYESREARMERLKEVWRSCVELVFAKEKAGKGTKR